MGGESLRKLHVLLLNARCTRVVQFHGGTREPRLTYLASRFFFSKCEQLPDGKAPKVQYLELYAIMEVHSK